MPQYKVKFKNDLQHIVKARSDDEAIGVWLDEQGYDSLDHAASEYFGLPDDFTVDEIQEYDDWDVV